MSARSTGTTSLRSSADVQTTGGMPCRCVATARRGRRRAAVRVRKGEATEARRRIANRCREPLRQLRPLSHARGKCTMTQTDETNAAPAQATTKPTDERAVENVNSKNDGGF